MTALAVQALAETAENSAYFAEALAPAVDLQDEVLEVLDIGACTFPG